MALTDFLAKLLIGSAITLTLSFLFRSVLLRLTKRSKTEFDDFFLSAFAASIVPFGLVVTLILAQDDLGFTRSSYAQELVCRTRGRRRRLPWLTISRPPVRGEQRPRRRKGQGANEIICPVHPRAERVLFVVLVDAFWHCVVLSRSVFSPRTGGRGSSAPARRAELRNVHLF